MIIVYPMLISENTNTNTLPPICKILEKYILVYRMDDIVGYMRTLSVPLSVPWAALNAKESKEIKIEKLSKKESKAQNLKEAPIKSSYEDENRKGLAGKEIKDPGLDPKNDPEYLDLQKQKLKGEIGRMERPEELGTVDIASPRKEDITLEPTWVKMSHPRLGSIIVGVKVIPFKVKSEYNYIHYMLNDIKAKMLQTTIESVKRKFIRVFWMFAKHLPFLSRTLTGDPAKDVLFASTIYRHNVFCLFNYMDLADSGLLSSAEQVNKLFKLGWNSIVLADDVNKRVTFCMKEFHGLCSVLPMSYVYSSFGRDYAKTFENIEDVRKSASPFFNVQSGKTLQKIMSVKEGKMVNNKVYAQAISKYLSEIYKRDED